MERMQIIKTILLWLLAIGFVLAGVYHFVSPEFYLRMMPPYIPWHRAMVAISGVAEIVLGLAVLVPQTRRLAGWGLIALLIAVFPANLYMAEHQELFPKITQASLYVRLPFQALFIAWAWWTTSPDSRPA
jgi:uncharacterized membrane protein